MTTQSGRNARRVLVVALVVSALLAGCASIRGFSEPPRVSVSNLRLAEATLLEQVYVVTVRVQNPGDRPLTLLGGSFDLEVNGLEFGHGLSDSRATVPPFGSTQIEVRMVSTLFDMVRLIQGFRERGDEPLSYTLSGWLQVDESFGRVGVRRSGELSLPKKAPLDSQIAPAT